MAEKKFSDLTAKGAALADTDLLAISEDAGGGAYTSKSVTGANVKALVTDANLTTTDITTNDVSTSKHGFAPKAPNDTTKFLRGDGTWAAPSAGGLTKFTEAENTSAPNGTVYVDSLTAAGSTTNVDVAIVPKGSGAFTLAIPDNTTTGGNKRGTRSVDLQTNRTSATQVASGNNSVVGGRENTVSGNDSVAFGAGNTASGAFSTASGVSCVASGILGATSIGYSNTSSGQSSTSFGYANIASGLQSTAIGSQNTASGNNSFAGGDRCQATGGDAIAFGNNAYANAEHAIAMGYYTSAFSVRGRWVTGQVNTVTGDCQKSIFCLSTRTTNNTATTLVSGFGAGAPSAINQVNLQNQSAYRFKGTIIGKQSGSTNAAAWDVDGLIVRGANAASTTLLISNVTLVQNTPAWGTPTLTADTTNGGLQVQVTGAAATNIQWTAVIETTEVIYA
jgi:hypothetical protein